MNVSDGSATMYRIANASTTIPYKCVSLWCTAQRCETNAT